jgi:hypothetical protein
VRTFGAQNLPPDMNIDRLSSGAAAPSPQDPAPPASTPSSSTCLPRLGGLLSCLGIRRSSALPAPRTTPFHNLQPDPVPPAEQKTEFRHLKPDVLSLIANKLAQGPRVDAAREVVRLSVVNQALREAVGTDPQARRRRTDGPLIENARQLIKELLSERQNDPDPQARFPRRVVGRQPRALPCLQVLGLLDRQQQATLVRLLVDQEDRSGNWHVLPIRFTAFSDLAPHLAELDPAVRADLVEWAIDYQSEAFTALAICGLGGALAHLEDASISQLVQRATTLRRPPKRAEAIRALSTGYGHMKDAPRQQLWQATMDLQDHQEHQGVAIQGLGAQLKYLLPDQQTHLFQLAIGLDDAKGRYPALIGLAASIEVLDSEQRQTLFTQALNLPAWHAWRWALVCTLAAGVEHLTPGEYAQLVGAIQGLGDSGPARAVAVLGAHSKHVDPQQQHQWLDGAADWSDEDRARVVQGFAAGFQDMEPACRRKVGALALGLDSDNCKAVAIGALGPHLKHLDEDQRHAVIEQACRVLDGEIVHHTLISSQVRRLTTGLGAGLEALRMDQRDALVAAVAALPLPSFDDTDLTSGMQKIAEAVAGLASGQQHLSEASFATLVQATSRLERFHGEFMSKPHSQEARQQATEAKATAIFGLVRG